jgi:hypothetical protein
MEWKSRKTKPANHLAHYRGLHGLGHTGSMAHCTGSGRGPSCGLAMKLVQSAHVAQLVLTGAR